MFRVLRFVQSVHYTIYSTYLTCLCTFAFCNYYEKKLHVHFRRCACHVRMCPILLARKREDDASAARCGPHGPAYIYMYVHIDMHNIYKDIDLHKVKSH